MSGYPLDHENDNDCNNRLKIVSEIIDTLGGMALHIGRDFISDWIT
jgi:hypothetical protein